MNAEIKLYNTRTKTVEPFIPHEKESVTMYTCGPTVYSYAHIGNLRSYIMEDVLEKLLNYAGYYVKRAMNITDVGHIVDDADSGEDKMLQSIRKERKSAMEIAAFYGAAFWEDCSRINIRKPQIVIPATSCIDEFIRLITILLEKHFAYLSGGNVYFDTAKFKNYYVLTGHETSSLNVAVREDVQEDTNKRNPNDFVLWFTQSKFANQELQWESPFGKGYPGWHIECSAISLKYLGEYLDIHCGGVDNIFPHHTNEIAQSEALVGHKWGTYWFHVQHLVTREGKMSKSSGKPLTLAFLQGKGYDPLIYRFFCLQSHYRKPLVFSFDALDNAALAYSKLKQRVASLSSQDKKVDQDLFSAYKKRFAEAVGNDLNTSLGITMLYEVLKDSALNDATKRLLVQSFDDVMSLNLTDTKAIKIDIRLEAYILQKIGERQAAKQDKNYPLADQIRNELKGKGIILIDSKDGTSWEVTSQVHP